MEKPWPGLVVSCQFEYFGHKYIKVKLIVTCKNNCNGSLACCASSKIRLDLEVIMCSVTLEMIEVNEIGQDEYDSHSYRLKLYMLFSNCLVPSLSLTTIGRLGIPVNALIHFRLPLFG